MKLFYTTHDLAFHHPFTISNGRTKSVQPTLIVALQLGNFVGFGEAPAITYYDVSIESMIQDIQQKHAHIEKFALTEPERYWHYLHHLLPKNPFLVAALDIACWDLFGNMKNKLLHEIWNTNWDNLPLTNLTIGIDTIENMVAKMKEAPAPFYKIKLGTPDDIAIVTELRKHTDAAFRVDVNGAWTLEEALEKTPQLQKLGVELIEQPLAKDNWEGMKQLYQQNILPLIADESCVFENDVAKCVGYFHGINIKLTKCSGITPALRMIQNAKAFNLQVMMGCMNESAIGSAAIAQFLPQLDYVDMDGPLLQSTILADGLEYNFGKINVQGKRGLGIIPRNIF